MRVLTMVADRRVRRMQGRRPTVQETLNPRRAENRNAIAVTWRASAEEPVSRTASTWAVLHGRSAPGLLLLQHPPSSHLEIAASILRLAGPSVHPPDGFVSGGLRRRGLRDLALGRVSGECRNAKGINLCHCES
jgi:hypothetical protein